MRALSNLHRSAPSLSMGTRSVAVATLGTVLLSAVLMSVAAAQSITTVPAGPGPGTMAVNSTTNKIYVADTGTNSIGNSVAVIDGANNSVAYVTTGNGPNSIAVNVATNKIYVANFFSSDVTVIDGATNATTTVPSCCACPTSIAVNPNTNKVYVADSCNSSVTVIDGMTNTTSLLSVTSINVGGGSPYGNRVPGNRLAVNPTTNKIYVAGDTGIGILTVIDGATNSTSIIPMGTDTCYIAVNPATNKIYVSNCQSSGKVTVVDGATNSTSFVPVGSYPWSIDINQVTNKIYVGNSQGNSISAIDGATNTVTAVPAGTSPAMLAVNPNTNTVYSANYDSSNVTVFGCPGPFPSSCPALSTIGAVPSPIFVAVNPMTNKVYVSNAGANWAGSSVTVIDYGYSVMFSGTTVGYPGDPGNWTGIGNAGYMIPLGNSTPFDHANLTLTEFFPYLWSNLASDKRTLQTAPCPYSLTCSMSRIASAFTNYYGKSIYIHLNIYDNKPHLVWFYLLDWENVMRTETFTISDASTGKLYDQRTFSNFSGGVYALWNLRGNLTIQVTPNSGSAVVSGIFMN